MAWVSIRLTELVDGTVQERKEAVDSLAVHP
jgi:hypothetical protein